MIERRASHAALVTVERDLAAAQRAEICSLQGPIRRRLAEEYRAQLYAR